MKKAMGHILKSSEVNLEGQFRLDVPQHEMGLPKAQNMASGKPEVHIVEKHSQFAVIEITCCCGIKTHLRCEYADAESSAQGPQAQNDAPENPEQISDQPK